MADADTVRIELAFEGGPIVAAIVKGADAAALEQAVVDGASGSLSLETDDGRLTVVVARVAYVKRFAREAKVGFGLSP